MPPEFLEDNTSDPKKTPEQEKNRPEELKIQAEKLQTALSQTPQESLQKPPKLGVDIKEFEPTWLKPLRTYKSDVSEAMQTKKGSLTRIVIAQKEREEERKEARLEKNSGVAKPPHAELPLKTVNIVPQKEALNIPPKEAPPQRFKVFVPPAPITFSEEPESIHARFMKRNIIIILLSFSFAVIGIGAAYGAFILLKEPVERPFEIAQTIIATEKIVEIELEYLTEDELRSLVAKELTSAPLQIGQVEVVYFTKNILSIGVETPIGKAGVGVIGTKELFTIVKNKMPSNLLRSLSDKEFLFGIHALTQNHPFLILKTDSFENAFSGMLRWEPYMFDDLAPLFNIGISDRGLVSRIAFEDSIIKNNDARILKNDLGKVVFVYAFIDRETLVLTTNINTLDEVVNRLKAPKKILR